MRKSLLFNILFLLGTLPVVYCQAQFSFQYKSILENVSNQGFYKIILPPAVIGKCTEVLTDIRILDEKGKQVPYILQTDEEEFRKNNFIELPILSAKKETDKQTHVVIQNQLNKPINEILLVIKNTEADRSVNISGSDDNKNWFVIKENVHLDNFIPPDNDDRFIQSLNFPSSSYKFFKVIINGKDLLPVNIVKAGVYQGLFNQSKYLPIPPPRFEQKDSSNKVSYIFVQFDDEYLINKLNLNIQGVKFFKRDLRIYKAVNNSKSWQQTYSINSAMPASYSINIKAKALDLEIYNEDNPPLKLAGIKAFQLNKSLLAYLDPGVRYELVFGDPAARSPSYDLGFFKDSIITTAAEIGIGPVIKNDLAKDINKPVSKTNTLILWIVIGAVLALLLTLTLRMTKEMKREEN